MELYKFVALGVSGALVFSVHEYQLVHGEHPVPIPSPVLPTITIVSSTASHPGMNILGLRILNHNPEWLQVGDIVTKPDSTIYINALARASALVSAHSCISI